MKIYTRTGDRGRTGLFSGERVSKADLRVSAYGTVDELNSVLGMLAAAVAGEFGHSAAGIRRIQSDLFRLGALFATSPGTPAFDELPALDPGSLAWMEAEIDRMQAVLPPLQGFILPGGHPAAALAHLARAVCRRTERRCVALVQAAQSAEAEAPFAPAIVYLNRLSDHLFVLARHLNHLAGLGDEPWEPCAS